MNGNLMEFVRAVVRPIITLSGWGVVSVMIYTHQDVPDAFFNAVSGLTVWWFATRQTQEKKP